MAQVRRIIDNVLIDYPFSFTHQGIDGQVVVDDLGEGNQIYFRYGVNTDITNDVAEIVTHISMADFYSLDLVSSDPEGVNPDAPVVPLEPTRVPNFSVPEGTAYREYISSGVNAGRTRIKLSITNNGENFPVEFSTFYHGSLSGTAGDYEPSTWATISRETDGTYYLMLPSDSTTPYSVAQPFWARFQGNTQTSFGAYYTFRVGGGEPITSGGSSGTTGSATAVDGDIRGFDLCCTVWGGYSGKDLTRNDAPSSKTHYAEQSAISGSNTTTYRDQAPFYAFHTGNQTIQVPIGVVGDPFHVNEPRFSNTDWQLDADKMKTCNEYLIAAGFQCWNFTYYANGYALSIMRQLFEAQSLADKRGIKAFYSLHQPGGSRGEYRDVNGNINTSNEYTININHIVSMMGQSWYKKIDGKPVIVYFDESESNIRTDAANLRAAYKEANPSVTDTYPFYEIQMTFLADPNNVFVNSMNMQARTWYYQTNNNSFTDHSLESSLSDSYTNFVDMGQNAGNLSRDVVPSLNVALDGRARWAYPLDTPCIDNITPGTASYGSGINWAGYNPPNGLRYTDKSYSYYNEATSSDVTSIFNKFAALKTLFGSRMKLAFVSTWDENSEGGKSTMMPKLNLDGTTINRDVIEWFRSHYNSGYTFP